MSLLAAHGAIMASGRVYATLNPADKGDNAGIVLSNGNRTATVGATPTAGLYYLARSTIGKSSGKWYWETTINRTGSGVNEYSYGSCVLCDDAYAMEQSSANFPGLTADVAGGPYFSTGTYVNNANVKALATVVGTVVVRHQLDMDSGTYQQAFGAGSLTTIMSGLTGAKYPAVVTREGSTPVGPKGFATQNFGQAAFAYSVPSGFNPGLFDMV